MSTFFNLKVMVSNSSFGKHDSPVSHMLDQIIAIRTVGIIYKFVIKIKFSIHLNKFHLMRFRVFLSIFEERVDTYCFRVLGFLLVIVKLVLVV